jgi:LacI family transcriptional regulator
LSIAEKSGFYAVETIRRRLLDGSTERRFGFLLNSADRELYRALAVELSSSTARSTSINGKSLVFHLEDTSPDAAAAALMELGEKCDAIACVCIDHPAINSAISSLRQQGVPVVSMISDVSCPDRAAFIGSNDWQLGRTAGWFASLLRNSGDAIVLMGSSRYLCQQAYEGGFRNYVRAEAEGLRIIESRFTDESDTVARAVMVELLDSNHDLSVIFVAGGGIDGVVQAISMRNRTNIAIVAAELTASTKAHLAAGLISVILVHPVRDIARETVGALVRLTSGTAPLHHFQEIVPFSIVARENC